MKLNYTYIILNLYNLYNQIKIITINFEDILCFCIFNLKNNYLTQYYYILITTLNKKLIFHSFHDLWVNYNIYYRG